jgi:methylenetetrahydrofolate dehydrogenase (NADP+) / methenyltetrahydrofolate cyclohydrolase
MIVDGKKIAQQIYESVRADVALLPKPPVLAAITCAPNFETQKYLALKKRKAAEVGIILQVVEVAETASTQEVISSIEAVLPQVDGVVVQLPFPSHIDREQVLAAVPAAKDPDGFSYGVTSRASIPPVVGAIQAIADAYSIVLPDAAVVVLGQGRLVGAPAAQYLRSIGTSVTTLTKETPNAVSAIKAADVIISGIGEPHFVTLAMVKPGVVVFDAGTSEDGGEVVGDVHPDVAHVAALFTPVPGGIGPITIAVLLRNLVSLVKEA